MYNSGYKLIRRLQNLLSFPYDGDPICLEPKSRNIISWEYLQYLQFNLILIDNKYVI